MDIKSLETCFQNASNISQTVEEYEILSEISSVLKRNSVNKDETSYENLLTDDFLKTIDYLSKDNGLYFTSNVTFDWFVLYLFSRRYPSRDANTSVATMNFNKPWRHSISADDEKFTERLHVPIDNLISWLWNRPFVKQNLRMYSSAIRLSQSHSVARRHLVSHAIKWTIHHLKNSNLDFTTGSPLTIPRGGSFDGIAEGGDLEPISDERVSNKDDSSESTAKWFSTVIESNGALNSGKKPVQILRLAIEELIVTCITDPQDEIRKVTFNRLQSFFQSASLPLSAVFCLRWIEISHQTPATNWIQQESLLKLINVVVDKFCDTAEASVQEAISSSQLLKRRISNAFISTLNKISNDDLPTSSNGKVTNPEDQKIKKALLPKVRNLTLGLIASHRVPIRQLAVKIYVNCVFLMHPENQAKILENAATTLEQDISHRLDEIVNNIHNNRPKLSQYLVESLTIICAKVIEMPNRSHCSVDWLQIAACCETMLSHPSQRVREASVDLLVGIFKTYKNSVQMVRAVMVVITQAWTSRQDVLFKPFNQLPHMSEFDPEREDKSKDCRRAWRSGHLMAYTKISQMLLEEYRQNFNNPLKRKKSLLSPLFNSNVARKISLSTNKTMLRKRSSEINLEAALLRRLKELETTELRQVIWNVRSASLPRNGRSRSVNGSELDFPISGSDAASVYSSSGYSSISSMSTHSPAPNNCNFRTCLTVVLHAAVECTCDSDRLIRHQATQALSEVSQVIGLFDHTLLTNIIMTHMSFEPTLLTYGCLEILLNILVGLNSVKIGNINISLTSTQQPSQLSPSLLNCLLSIERSRVWLRTCSHYIGLRETFDAVTLNAVQIVMCALTSVHQLAHISKRFSQIRLDSLTEEDEEADDEDHENGDDRDCDQGFEDESKMSSAPGDSNLDIDIESLVSAVCSLEVIIQRLLALHSSRHKELDCYGWIPESPTRRRKSANGIIYTATNDESYLEFTYLLLRRIELPLQVYLNCNSRRSLSHYPRHLKPMNAETVAVALSRLVNPLASLGFEMYMTQFISRRQESIGGCTTPAYIEALREMCMISIINLIGLITESLPKNPVLGVDTNDFNNSRKQSQSTVNRLECYVNYSTQIKETCDKFINILYEIMNFARRNLHPKSFMECPHWWWMGHMCSSLPNLCQAAPGQADTSRLVELLCNEIFTLRNSTNSPKGSDLNSAMDGLRDNRNRYSTLPSMPRSPPARSSLPSPTSPRERNSAQLNWIRVKHASMAVAAFQKTARKSQQQSNVEAISVRNGGIQSDEEGSNSESDMESTSTGIECNDSKALNDKSRLGSESSYTLLLKKEDFPPLSTDETSNLVAKLIKCSDARTIEPLQNVIPRDIITRVRKMLQEEQRT